MFTGIVEEIGIIREINKTWTGISLKINASDIYRDVKLGDSVAINGVCLTVTGKKDNILSFDVIQETLARTNLGELRVNDAVNLENSMRADSRISGHFVSGHIDYKARIDEVLKGSESRGIRVSLPEEFLNLIVPKGSVAVDGVSLTVADVSREGFIVYLIPHTLKVTTLDKKKEGDSVNVEIDLFAKYLAKYIQKPNLQDLLKKYKYI